jgi:hypothetical protein
MNSYEPPISEGKMPLAAWQPTTQLAPGVRGFSFHKRDRIIILLIVSENEGSGDVGRFLDQLSPRCVIMCVTSDRLRGMLERRDFTSVEFDGIDYWAKIEMYDVWDLCSDVLSRT